MSRELFSIFVPPEGPCHPNRGGILRRLDWAGSKDDKVLDSLLPGNNEVRSGGGEILQPGAFFDSGEEFSRRW